MTGMQDHTALALKCSKGEIIVVKGLKIIASPSLEISWNSHFQKALQRKVVSTVYNKGIINHWILVLSMVKPPPSAHLTKTRHEIYGKDYLYFSTCEWKLHVKRLIIHSKNYILNMFFNWRVILIISTDEFHS